MPLGWVSPQESVECVARLEDTDKKLANLLRPCTFHSHQISTYLQLDVVHSPGL
jgi:hypothetical protein